MRAIICYRYMNSKKDELFIFPEIYMTYISKHFHQSLAKKTQKGK